MEITIGVQNQARELTLESDETAESVTTAVREAIAGGGVLDLTDSKGRRILVPTASLGYVELGAEEQRRVGFGGAH
ncbi:DUF3107 domain-containing protein [Isoptericola sp. NEAU-Y5]|uniref:DUF3107 domain-containing protein n=1 Tax=Isoptericola luteus TaxID=2879484 RepID=A0ABS7ZBQ8_9MICO|nr:DUF3107 domain-containing protein [Isoptericola sp. NEAU-Y5]MCA5892481.1 DUF3107 domain-containing protein [Isoptericola sp. NEAU-Y5]